MARLPSFVSAGLGLAALIAVAGCSKSDPSPTSTAPPRDVAKGAAPSEGAVARGGGPAPAVGAGGGEAAAPGADTSFQLTHEQAAPTAAGGEAVARLVVRPGSGYHMNKEFPTKLTLEPPAGVTLAKTVLVLDDAERFSDNELAFAVKMSAAAAGEYTIPGTFKFAVCTDTTCDPKKQKVSLVLKAN